MADVNLDVLLTGDAKDLDAALREAKGQTRGLRTEFRELTAEERRNERAMEGVSRSAKRYAKDQELAKDITDQLNGELKEMRRDLQLAVQGLNAEGRALHGASRASRTKSALTKQLSIDLKKQEISTRRAADALLEETRAAIAAAAGISRKGNAAKEAASEQELLALAAKHAADGMEHEAVVAALAAKELDKKGRSSRGAARDQHTLAGAADDTRHALRRERDELSRLDMEWRRANWDKIIDRRNEGLNRSLLGEAAHIAALRAIVQPVRTLKWSSIMLGIAPVSAALIDLAGAGVTAINSLEPLAASVGPMMIQTFGGMAQAALVLKLGLKGVGDAAFGKTKSIRDSAFGRLTDEAKEFVTMLRKDFLPALGETRRQIQTGLFPGLTAGLDEAKKAIPEVQKLLYNMALTVGGVAEDAGQMIGRKGFRTDMLKIGSQQISIVERGGKTILNIVSGIRHILVASRPLVRAWSEEFLEISKSFNEWAREARKDGTLQSFFREALANSRQWFHILEDIGRIIVGVFGAGRAASGTFLDALERTFDEWADFVNSTKGQNDVAEYLNESVKGAGQLWEILEAIIGTIFRLGQVGNEHLGDLADFIREDLLVSLEAFGSTLQNLLPHLLDTLGSLMEITRETFEAFNALEPVLAAVADSLQAIFGTMADVMDVMPGVLKIPTALILGSFVLGGYRTLVQLLKEAAKWSGLVSVTSGFGSIAGGWKGTSKTGVVKSGAVKSVAGGAGFGAGVQGVVTSLKHPAVIAAIAAVGAIAFGITKLDHQREKLPGTNLNVPNVGSREAAARANFIKPLYETGSRLGDLKLDALANEIKKVGGNITDLPTSKVRELQNRIRDLNDETTSDVREELRKLNGDLRDLLSRRKAFAVSVAVGGFADELREMFRKGKEVTAKGAKDIADLFKQLPKEGRAAGFELMKQFVGEMRKKGKIAPQVAKALMDNVRDEYRRGRHKGVEELVKMGTSLAGIFGAFPKATGLPLKRMGEQINTFLNGLGLKSTKIDISKLEQGVVIATNLFESFMGNRAGGGYVGSAGQRGRDEHTIRVGDGEAVVNGPQQGPIQTAMAYASSHGVVPYGSLQDLFKNEKTKHYLASGNAHLPKFATGGFAGGLQPGISELVDIVRSRYPGLAITSTTGGNHASGSYHYRGMAADLSGPGMYHASTFVKNNYTSSLAEGIHNPNLSVKGGRQVDPGFWGSGTWGDHADHIHLAVAGMLKQVLGGGARLRGAMKQLDLPRYVLKGGGSDVLKGAAQNILDSARSIALEWSKSKGGGGFGDFEGGGKSLMMQIAKARGWNFGDWWEVDRRETNHGADTLNESSGAFNRAQFMPGITEGQYGPGSKKGASMREQIISMAKYISSRYGNPTAALAHHNAFNWYDEGGFVGAADGYVAGQLQDPPDLGSQEGREQDSGGGDGSRDTRRRGAARRKATQLLKNKPNPKPDYARERELSRRRKKKGPEDRPDLLRLFEKKSMFHLGRDLRRFAGLKTPFNQMIEDQLFDIGRLEHTAGLTDEQPTIDQLRHAFVGNQNKRVEMTGAWDGKTLGILKGGKRVPRWLSTTELDAGGVEFDGEFFQEILNPDGGVDATSGKFVPGIKAAVWELTQQLQSNTQLGNIYGSGSAAYRHSIPKILKKVIGPRRKYIGQLRDAWKEMFKAVERFKEQKRVEIKAGGTWKEKKQAHGKTIAQLKRWREKLRAVDPQTPYVQEQLEDVDRQIRWNENQADHLEHAKPKGKNPKVVRLLDELIARDGGYMTEIAGNRHRLPAPGRESQGILGAIRGQVHGARTVIGNREEQAKIWDSSAIDTRDIVDLLRKDIGQWAGTSMPKEAREAPEKPDADTGSEISGLIEQQAASLAEALRRQSAQFDVFKGFARLPYLGSFQVGSDVFSQKGYALVHPGERIVPDPQGPFRNGINSNMAGGRMEVVATLELVDRTRGGLSEFVDARIVKVAPRVVSRATGTKTRQIRSAPGRP